MTHSPFSASRVPSPSQRWLQQQSGRQLGREPNASHDMDNPFEEMQDFIPNWGHVLSQTSWKGMPRYAGCSSALVNGQYKKVDIVVATIVLGFKELGLTTRKTRRTGAGKLGSFFPSISDCFSQNDHFSIHYLGPLGKRPAGQQTSCILE